MEGLLQLQLLCEQRKQGVGDSRTPRLLPARLRAARGAGCVPGTACLWLEALCKQTLAAQGWVSITQQSDALWDLVGTVNTHSQSVLRCAAVCLWNEPGPGCDPGLVSCQTAPGSSFPGRWEVATGLRAVPGPPAGCCHRLQGSAEPGAPHLAAGLK